jgi:hypothetical protein
MMLIVLEAQAASPNQYPMDKTAGEDTCASTFKKFLLTPPTQ